MLAGGAGACASAPTPPYVVELTGEARFSHGDDPGFAAIDLDDAHWDTVTVPHSWRAWTRPTTSGWYRIHFQLPAGVPAQGLAFDLGVIGWTDQVFLNGTLIGATGDMDSFPDPVYAPRVYPLPAAALRPGDNLLAIRVHSLPLAPCGLLSPRIGIGDELALARWRGRAMARTVSIEATFFGFLGFGWLLVAFFPRRGQAGRATRFLLASLTLQLGHLWLVSVIGHDSGWTPRAAPQIALALVAGGAWCAWAFIATITTGRIPRPLLAVIIVHLAVMLTLVVSTVAGWTGGQGPLVLVALLVALAAAAILARFLIGAIRAGTPGALPLVAGVAGMALSVLAMTAMPRPYLAGVLKVYYGLALLAACAMLALTRHVREMNRQAQRAADYALEAHARERLRLSRDLHDGLGQMLALLKMQLQRAGHKPDGEPARRSLDEGVAQLDATIEEMRRISRDLRPAPLEDRGFGEAVREYAAALSRRSDIEVVVEGDYPDGLREEIGDELYRIVQECLTNCVKHSGARRITVTLAAQAGHFTLAVVDDGRGLPAEPTAGGIGLSTIRERSELLGGGCTVSAPADGGTRVDVRVPR